MSSAEMHEAAGQASDLLKALANSDRLLIVCHLADGEKSVSELQEILGLRQSTLSQQLSRLRLEQLVENRRDGNTIYYSLCSDDAGRVIELLHAMYCTPKDRKFADGRSGKGAKRPIREILPA